MKQDRMLIAIFMAGILAWTSSVFAVSISVSGDAGGFTEEINAGKEDFVSGYAAIAADGLSNYIEGGGNLRERHQVANTRGSSASAGADVRNAQSYSYGYYLSPGHGSFWPANIYPEVVAGETLSVANADYIKAYATAHNAQGMSASVSTVLSDPNGEASLSGYSNSATASAQEVRAIQGAEGAWAPQGYIQTEAQSGLAQISFFPLQLLREKEAASTTVNEGSLIGFSDGAIAKSDGLAAVQEIDSASGKWINTQSKTDVWLLPLFSSLKRYSAEVRTGIAGSLTGYQGVVKSTDDRNLAYQSGHITGTFSSAATTGDASKTRSSNYGTDYDFEMLAMKDPSRSIASGTLGYYVDIDQPGADRIQGAVDASQAGDTINVAEALTMRMSRSTNRYP